MCIIEGSKFSLDQDIVDASSITLMIERDGLATLSLILTSETQKDLGCYTFAIGGKTFNGIIESVTPSKLSGTELIENAIIAKGRVTQII